MPNITKPNDVNNVWATTGDIVAPAADYVANGWEAIIPPREYFNWLDNRQDRFNAHVNQHGIPVWDSFTEYQANLSYSKGTDGVLYRAVTTNSNINPVGDITGAWQAQNFGGIARFTSNGSFTVPVGVTKLYVSGCAGGGGGGATLATNSSSNLTGGSGGGAGQSVINLPITVTPGQVLAITIGVGGVGGTPPLDNASFGTATRLGNLLNLTGGGKGTRGVGGTTVPFNYGGPAGGSGYPNGGYAMDTTVYAGGVTSGGGGGQGANTPFGVAGPAGRGASGSSIAGLPGFGYGAGGSGAGGAYNSLISAPGAAGAAGLPGILIIEW